MIQWTEKLSDCIKDHQSKQICEVHCWLFFSCSLESFVAKKIPCHPFSGSCQLSLLPLGSLASPKVFSHMLRDVLGTGCSPSTSSNQWKAKAGVTIETQPNLETVHEGLWYKGDVTLWFLLFQSFSKITIMEVLF